jgi:hypothetical protein
VEQWGEYFIKGGFYEYDSVNTGANIFAKLSPDGKCLFYHANHDIYWVDARVIEEMKPREMK